ncbi:MAG: glycosyltransferase family 4 protein [Flavobacteriales bacterium]|nr:glycosyltransferase family 4 protein [Flavobacteriales bacterium]
MAIIAVNTRLLISGRVDGISRFAAETLKRIVKAHPEHTFYFLFDRKFSDEFIFSSNVKPLVIWPQTRHPLLFRFWFEKRIPIVLKKIKADVFVSPDGFLSLASNVKQLAVIHDLNFEHFPQYLPSHIANYYRRYFPLFAHKASKIATVSAFSKQDICERYRIKEDKIDVVYNGVSTIFTPVTPEVKLQIQKQYSQQTPYFIYAGTLHPRKNIVNLIKAFDRVKTKSLLPHKLLLVGSKMWWTDEMQYAYNEMKHKHDVIFTGLVSDSEMANLMASAEAMVYVSFFEGFGIPVIEAQSCDVPVICSDTTSLAEIAGTSAILVNPSNVEEIAQAMIRALEPQKRTELILNGQKNVLNYSWNKTASFLWESIEKTLHV